MKRFAMGFAVAGMGAAAFHALRQAPDDVRLERVHLPVPRLPGSTRALEVLFLTDAHHWEWGVREDRVIELLERESPPDLVVWGGDFLGAPTGIPTALRFIEAVFALYPGVPAIAVRGNAEHKIRPAERLDFEENLRSLGVVVLVNAHHRLAIAGSDWVLAGTDDPYYGFCDLDATLAGVDRDELVMLVSHSPQIASRAAQAGVDVLLSGHTHGGQVRIPGFGAVRTQNPLSRRIDCGVFDRARLEQCLGGSLGGDMVSYVSRGLGVAFVPRMPWLAPRLFCPPEVTRLSLVGPDSVSEQ